ncbi:polysaccharide biosynthesis/export family protein [Sphingomonas lycopersici]|uniref:Polysaccharide biosynthesis/export family protein n=1 Tax=Sphingomonas lycopersici TaxID=2951807 RepID=A0AA41Z9L5_9SPHN|nr:polysaccharide biosynthesis/export family protein [Sphingomonas lycopersici]MCW6535126.1 polysaccharide biosynthesis/export family protein [Sphingomonas lycopersici]
MTCQAYHRKMLLTAACAGLAMTSGCSTLPQAGPVGKTVTRAGDRGAFNVIEVDANTALPTPPAAPDYTPLPPGWKSDVEAIAPGDVISVTYYEVGARLFSGAPSAPGASFDPTAKEQKIGPIEVDQAGTIRLPYSGTLRAAGRTPAELSRDIEASLRGKSENPQVLVRIEGAAGSSVMIGGEITSRGRVRLTGAREKLLDVITLAGGARGSNADIMVQVNRQGAISEWPLDGMSYANIGGMPMEPGDRVELRRLPQSYAVLGSANRVNRYDLPLRRFSLVEALALSGGPTENVADPAAVFVFRFEKTGDAGVERPTVYHFNMLKPTSYFLGQKFYMTDKDVIYVAGAEANQPSKLLQIIGQVFNPLAIAWQVVK